MLTRQSPPLMYRTFVILRHTFLESIVQPIYSLLIGLGAAIIIIFAMLPFFTLGEDTIMYKAVALDIVLLLVLIATLFATSKSIYEEIEDRTMLTLMSKPVAKWEVLLGKYLGIIAAAAMAIAILGAIIAISLAWRIPGDYQLNPNALDEREIRTIWGFRMLHLAGLWPGLVLMWLQISVLAAVSVAISTRLSLVVNLPAVIIIYFAGNLTRFIYPLDSGPLAGRGTITKWLASLASIVLPYLENFDLRQKTIYSRVALAGTAFETGAVKVSELWSYTGIAALYAICYVTFALAVGMLLFQTRELGGGEG
ncbi:MAG: ABC transporter permease subunit [Anaerolineae bacterium]|nr:ABC transporter permease subunit [Phycisphaerae bacterium]